MNKQRHKHETRVIGSWLKSFLSGALPLKKIVDSISSLSRWSVITKCDSFFITKCEKCYYKVQQALQSGTILLESATVQCLELLNS